MNASQRELEGRAAIVTESTKNPGRQIARTLAAAGASVIVNGGRHVAIA